MHIYACVGAGECVFMECRYGRIQCNGYMCTRTRLLPTLCSTHSGCAIADMMNALFRLLLSVRYCWLVGWFVVCSFYIQTTEWFSAYLFVCSVSFSHKQIMRWVCVLYACFPLSNVLPHLHLHNSYAPTYACTITHMTTQMAKCQCLCLCDR